MPFGTMLSMMYMVLMYSDPAATKAMSASDRDAVRRRHEALHADEGTAMLNGAGLAYPEHTTTIRLENDRPIAMDGPLVSAREQLTAYYVVECASGGECEVHRRTGLGFPRHRRGSTRGP